MIVPIAAGGGADAIARVAAERMARMRSRVSRPNA
jgi:tripartite-type tricarboxylate transporter receptor subunit TctC